MDKKEEKLLNRVFQDAQVGMIAIDKILKKIKDENLKKIFKKQFDMYQEFGEKCDVFAINSNVEIKENNFFKKFKEAAMVYISLWMDKTPRHIVEMMINGTVMGIIDTIKVQKDLKTKNEELNAMVAEFLQMQEEFYEKLKKQLARV